MKNILQIFFVLLSVVGFGQTPPNGWQTLPFTVSGGNCDVIIGGGTGEIFISELYDGEQAAQGGNEQSYAIIELHNPTNSAINLSNYRLRRDGHDSGTSSGWSGTWGGATGTSLPGSIPANGYYLIRIESGNGVSTCSISPNLDLSSSYGINALDQIQLLKNGRPIDEIRMPNFTGLTMIRKRDAEVPKMPFNSNDWTPPSNSPSCADIGDHKIDPSIPPKIKFIARRPDTGGPTFNQCTNTIQIRMDQSIPGYVYRYNLQGTTTPINVIENTSGTFSNLPLDTYIMTVSVRHSTASTLEICTIEVTFTITGGIQTSPIILLNP